MSRYTVICHRCGKPTFVDLSKTVSDQRCRSCRGFLQGVGVSVGDKPKSLKRKLVWKVAVAGVQGTEWRAALLAVISIRPGWAWVFRGTAIGRDAASLCAIRRGYC